MHVNVFRGKNDLIDINILPWSQFTNRKDIPLNLAWIDNHIHCKLLDEITSQTSAVQPLGWQIDPTLYWPFYCLSMLG